MRILTHYRELLFCSVFGLLALGPTHVVVSSPSFGWSEPLRLPYCEAFHRGLFAQPSNTLSNASFVFVGAYIFYQVGRRRSKLSPERGQKYYVLYGFIAVALGVGSACFHATLSDWGGIFDNLTMNLMGSFLLLFNLGRLFRWTFFQFSYLYFLFNVISTLLLAYDNTLSIVLFSLLLLCVALSELAIVYRGKAAGRGRGVSSNHFVRAIGSMIVGAGVWRLSDTGGPLCFPNSVWQGHSVWHLLCASSLVFLFWHMRAVSPLRALSVPPVPLIGSANRQSVYESSIKARVTPT